MGTTRHGYGIWGDDDLVSKPDPLQVTAVMVRAHEQPGRQPCGFSFSQENDWNLEQANGLQKPGAMYQRRADFGSMLDIVQIEYQARQLSPHCKNREHARQLVSEKHIVSLIEAGFQSFGLFGSSILERFGAKRIAKRRKQTVP